MKRYRPHIESGRYAFMPSKAVLQEDPNGEAVRYEDHLAECEKLQRLIDSHEAILKLLTPALSRTEAHWILLPEEPK